MIPPRMVLLQLLQVRLSCSCLLAAVLVSLNVVMLWWFGGGASGCFDTMILKRIMLVCLNLSVCLNV
jgi:hypothetical protein